jgi:hypothetical protein
MPIGVKNSLEMRCVDAMWTKAGERFVWPKALMFRALLMHLGKAQGVHTRVWEIAS